MTKFTPVFTKDGDTYIVPDSDFVQESAELADVAGVGAGLAAEYGLNYTGRTEELSDEGKYPGPYVTATIRDKQVQIIGGQTLVSAVENGSAENVLSPESDAGKAAVEAFVAKVDVPVVSVTSGPDATVTFDGGDHTGPDAL